MVETWLEHAEQFLGKHQWGPQGKYIGVSRMLKEEDLDSLRKSKVVISQRPRGILSGFLAILPNNGNAVYIPPVSGKVGPRSIRVRHRLEKGAIFSAYWLRNDLILEDVIVWNDDSVWMNKTFEYNFRGEMKDLESINHVSISSNKPLFHTNEFCSAFLYLQFVFIFFWRKENSKKLLVKCW